MESTLLESANTHSKLAARLRQLRTARGLTLDGLADRAGVSRSMISLIEREESSPTAAVLDRLAAGLGVTLASLFADEQRPDASPVARRADQTTWRDPETGYVRRNLSPASFPSPIELVEVVLPAGARVSYDSVRPSRVAPISQQIYLLEGAVELTIADVTHQLDAGDCLAMRLDAPISFRNPAATDARYLVALTAEGASPALGVSIPRGNAP